MWRKMGLYDILATDSGHFFFKFNSDAECEVILEGGPWYIAGKPIILRKWQPGLKFDKEAVKTIPVWCIFSYLPLELWTAEGFSRVASAIGRPIQVDRMTATRRRITYARICIEINAETEPIFELDVQYRNPITGGNESVKVNVEYQWTPSRCTKCLVFGHDCSKNNTKPAQPVVVKGTETTQDAWMTRRKGKDKIIGK